MAKKPHAEPWRLRADGNAFVVQADSYVLDERHKRVSKTGGLLTQLINRFGSRQRPSLLSPLSPDCWGRGEPE